MTAGEGIPLNIFKCIESMTDPFCEPDAGNRIYLKVVKGEPRTNRRNEEVGQITKIESEHDDENKMVETIQIPSFI